MALTVDVAALMANAESAVQPLIPVMAAAAYQAIIDDPTSVIFIKQDGTTQAAQTVRLEHDNSVSMVESPAGISAIRKLTIFGIQGHTTLPNTVMAVGWKVVVNAREYTIRDIIYKPGEIQARAEHYG